MAPRPTRSAAGVAALLAATTPAAAHSGTTHAGTPHWGLFALVVVGLALLAASAVGARREMLSTRAALGTLFAGGVATLLGAVGLVELQVVARTPPDLLAYYPTASLVVGALLGVGGFALVRLYRPEAPEYALLCLVLAGWILYPAVMPRGGYYHPGGYALALALPVTVGVTLRRHARGVLQGVRRERTPLAVGAAAGTLFAVFFAFSAGTVTLNPDDGVNAPTEAFVVFYDVAEPLVVWPAVEFAAPSVPLAGYVSVGTLLLMGTLGGLVGTNAAVVAQQFRGARAGAGKTSFTGTLAASGATACCCCAPAFYGVVSVLFGSAATPVYWSFMVPASPVGGTFLAGSVLLLVGSVVRAGGTRSPTA